MENLIIIDKAEQLPELIAYIEQNEYIAYDTETDGVGKDAHIIGFSISADPDTGYYVILSYWDVEKEALVDLSIKNDIIKVIQLLVGKSLIMHNATFDCFMTYNNFKIQLLPSLHTDTMILGHVLNENRSNGLKELGVSIYGEDSRKEQTEMKESVHKNGGVLTKNKYELFKADPYLIGRYGAKDAILTIKLFYHLVPSLYDEKLDKFFYEEESMHMIKGPTYELNTVGLKVDVEKLKILKSSLEATCLELKSFIYKEITPHVKEKYKGTLPSNTFNIAANQQLSWLLFEVLKNDFGTLTKGGRELCKALKIKIPYSPGKRREFVNLCLESKDHIYEEGKFNPKTGKVGRPKKIADYWKYLATDKYVLQKLAGKYKWVASLLEYSKNMTLLQTYAEGIQSRVKYGIISPSFLQHGTTSGRYSSKSPNFQNLPRDDKRVKACIISRPGKVFVGADYAQLEPRVFASVSQDPTLMGCFEKGEDFYSVVGIPIFGKHDSSPRKSDQNSFAEKYPQLRNIAKAFALATPYGTSAFRQAQALDRPVDECQKIIDKYFESYPKVELMMLESHEQAKTDGVVYNLYGRPRRIPEAKNISAICGKDTLHSELPYSARTLLNLAMNHRVQSTAASIVNRAMVAFYMRIRALGIKECHIVLQVHDEIVVECLEADSSRVSAVLKQAMENTTTLPGVKLVADPKVAKNLADLK